MMKNTFATAIILIAGVVSLFAQTSGDRDAFRKLERALKGSSPILSKVKVESCVASVSIVRSEFVPSSNQQFASPPQGMAGFPTSDYGFASPMYDSHRKYKETNYKIDLAKADSQTVNTSSFKLRGMTFASLSLSTETDGVVVKAGKENTSTNLFTISISPKAVGRVTNAFREAISQCSAAK